MGSIFATHSDFVIESSTVSAGEVSYGECKSFLKSNNFHSDVPANQSCIYYEYKDTQLKINHVNAGFNCCPEGISVEINKSNESIEITELEEYGLCDCLCLFDIEYSISYVEPAEYTFIFIEPYSNELNELKFTINLAEQSKGNFCVTRESYPWGIY
mgnify:CR=1 FL=1